MPRPKMFIGPGIPSPHMPHTPEARAKISAGIRRALAERETTEVSFARGTLRRIAALAKAEGLSAEEWIRAAARRSFPENRKRNP